MVTPFEKTITFITEEGAEISQLVSGIIPVEFLGAASIFVALIVGMLASSNQEIL